MFCILLNISVESPFLLSWNLHILCQSNQKTLGCLSLGEIQFKKCGWSLVVFVLKYDPGGCFNIKMPYHIYSLIKIKWSHEHFIFIMEIITPRKNRPYIEILPGTISMDSHYEYKMLIFIMGIPMTVKMVFIFKQYPGSCQ